MNQLTNKWTRQFGSNQNDQASAITTDASGNIYVFVTIAGNGGSNQQGNLIIKYNPSGEQLWEMSLDYITAPQSIACDKLGFLYLTGADNNTTPNKKMFLEKINTIDGSREWFKELEDAFPIKVITDEEGNIYVAGTTAKVLSTEAGYTLKNRIETFVAKYDSSGNQLWIRQQNTFSLFSEPERFGFEPTDEDTVYVLDAALGPLNSIYIVADLELAGLIWQSDGEDDFVYMKFDKDGNLEMSTGEASYPSIDAIGVDKDGNFYSCSHLDETSPNFGLTKYDKDGRYQWFKPIGNFADLEDWYDNYNYSGNVNSISVDHQNNIVITGSIAYSLFIGENTAKGGDDCFIAKFSTKGEQLLAQQFGTAENEEGTNITVDEVGNIYILGVTNGEMENGKQKGARDIFLSKWVSKQGIDITETHNAIFEQSQSIYALSKAMEQQMAALSDQLNHLENEISNRSLQLDATLMFEANKKISRVGDYRISGKEAGELVEFAKKGSDEIGQLEQKTLAHIYAAYNLTKPAEKTFSDALKS